MHFDFLSDSRRSLVFLIDCVVKEDEILCGLATFRGGLSGLQFVESGGDKFRIQIPESAKQAATWLNVCDRTKRYKVRRIN